MPSRGEREPRKHRSRTSQDLGYGGHDGQQGDGFEGGYGNDYGQERTRDKDRKENRRSRGYDDGLVKEKNAAAGRRYDVQAPDASIVLEGYRADILNGFEEPQERYNPVNTAHPQSSMLLNINDPIQVHLLVETALWDAREYEILSPEEVDDLKKQCQSLNQRIQTARQNLVVHSKYRDAARSMTKLYPDKKKSVDLNDANKQKRGIFGNRNRSNSDQVREADIERAASEKKCEDLAAELWSLEKRLIEPEHRLLKHTAGILQMTHKGPKRDSGGDDSRQGGIPPGSPESMYTYHNARNSLEVIEDEFDERSLYRQLDPLDISFGAFGMNQALETPSTERSKEHMQLITTTEQKLEDLNSALREVIIKANPGHDASQNPVPLARTNAQGKPTQPGETLQNHLDYLEKGIATLDLEYTASKRQADELNASMEDTLEELNREVRGLLSPTHPELQEPPAITGQQTGLREQLYYFQDIIASVEEQLTKAAEIVANPPVNKSKSGDSDQMEAVLMGLWDIIQSGEEEIRKQKQERRQNRAANGRVPQDDSDTGSEMGDPNEPFTLQSFSAKVQWLYSSATKLKEHKKVLQRQIKQQRELNNKSDAQKDAELVSKQEELDKTIGLLERTERNAADLQEQLSNVMTELMKARQADKMDTEAQAKDSASLRELQEQLAESRRLHEEELTNSHREASERIASLTDAHRDSQEQLAIAARDSQERIAGLATTNRNLEDQLTAANKKIDELENELQDLKDDNGINSADVTSKLSGHEARIAELSTAVAAAATTRVAHENSLREKDKLLAEKEKEVEDISMKVAELQTEVVIARAELDGAYGSRAQRAAEVASNPAIQKEIDAMTNKNKALQEQMDALHNKNFMLQGEIAELQAARSPGPTASSAEAEAKLKELKKELEETIEEYEIMTKASIEWEKEREKLEADIDKLRDERENLESQLSDEKVRNLGMRSPGDGSVTPTMNNTSTTVLKNEFKKMMRDSRAEGLRALRAEQTERRRIEEELRAIKKAQGPGRSRLSQSVS
ncbi:hypothetical protein BELL_0026g00280 [Botrytis elliptica]|uniref:Uncharacterized protein n=1 Tax=Botrytis elliptica TaxID=278938 RepID=A0A4Z1K7Z4_9HELO|nr:hypothetical protein EAE99_000113 [Botrytis elliptica]TGO79672.1 hypothetical protein BELL_0026g00280 [Botrytis elliptica]